MSTNPVHSQVGSRSDKSSLFWTLVCCKYLIIQEEFLLLFFFLFFSFPSFSPFSLFSFLFYFVLFYFILNYFLSFYFLFFSSSSSFYFFEEEEEEEELSLPSFDILGVAKKHHHTHKSTSSKTILSCNIIWRYFQSAWSHLCILIPTHAHTIGNWQAANLARKQQQARNENEGAHKDQREHIYWRRLG